MASQARERQPGGPGRPGGYGRGLSRYVRGYVAPPSYRPGERLALVTSDGVRLAGARLAGPADAFATVVLVHGLVHSSRTPGIYRFAHRLARNVHVVVPELRGHGRSGGASSFGADEPRDVQAAVEAAASAHPGLPVVTVGVSLGGAAVLLHAGTYGGVAGVVAVSAPAWWSALDTKATRRVRWWVMTRGGRLFVRCALGTRIAPSCDAVPNAHTIVAAISPAHTLVVHDPADHYFGPAHPEAIYGWAQEPKALWWEEGTGHGTDLLTEAFASRLLSELRRWPAVAARRA